MMNYSPYVTLWQWGNSWFACRPFTISPISSWCLLIRWKLINFIVYKECSYLGYFVKNMYCGHAPEYLKFILWIHCILLHWHEMPSFLSLPFFLNPKVFSSSNLFMPCLKYFLLWSRNVLSWHCSFFRFLLPMATLNYKVQHKPNGTRDIWTLFHGRWYLLVYMAPSWVVR